MMGKTHMTFSGGICGLTWVAVTQPSPIDAGIMVAAATFGGLLPDIDHPQATISRKNIIFGALSRVISAFPWGKHRRVVHTVPFCVLFGIAGFVLTRFLGQFVLMGINKAPIDMTIAGENVTHVAILIGMGFLIGSFGHLLADMCNKEGIMLLWPVSSKRFSILPITTSSPLETLFFVATIVVTIAIGGIVLKQGYGDVLPNMNFGNFIPKSS